jgi:UDP-N-acetyl-D-glucosamine/UDP-N-acetyl-D-galactosamine dehydrogenase
MPGNSEHDLENTTKIIAGYDNLSRQLMSFVYGKVCDEVVMAKRLEEAEAAKLIENSQRDVNLAFLNECAMELNSKELDHNHVFELCRGHWNWINLEPGLVGGSCIPVNPLYLWGKFYLDYEENTLLTMARCTNESMPGFIAKVINDIVDNERGKRILILGGTYKSNVNCMENSGLLKLKQELMNWQNDVDIWEPVAGLDNINESDYDIVIIGTDSDWVLDFIHQPVNTKAVGLARFYKENLKEEDRVLVDIPGVFTGKYQTYKYWRLR